MSSQFEAGLQARETAVYEIRVEGRLGTEWSEWFADLRVTVDECGDTILTGPIDQSGLHGVLRRVRDLGLPLVSVARIEPDSGLTPERPTPTLTPDTAEEPIQ
jgi:hypothetical protein